MNPHFRNRQLLPSNNNPLVNVLLAVVGIVVVSLSLALGFFFFLGIAGLMLVIGAYVSVRVWWLKRKMRSAEPVSPPPKQEKSGSGRVIEGEFLEVRRPDKDG